jgi:hypothetical protein
VSRDGPVGGRPVLVDQLAVERADGVPHEHKVGRAYELRRDDEASDNRC